MNPVFNFVSQSYFLLWAGIGLFILWLIYTIISVVIIVHPSTYRPVMSVATNKILFKINHFLFLNKISRVLIQFLLICAIVLCFGVLLSSKPAIISPANASFEQSRLDKDHPIEVVFNRMILSKALDAHFSPDLKGQWQSKVNYLTARTHLIFTPSESALNATRYTINLTNIRSYLNDYNEQYQFTFETPPIPKIISVTPSDETNEIMPKDTIKVVFDNDWFESTLISAIVEPSVELKTERQGTELQIRAIDSFKKGVRYQLKILISNALTDYLNNSKKAISEEEVIYEGVFAVIPAPGIAAYGPKGVDVKVNEEIFLEFKQDMDQNKTLEALEISPKIEGSWQWISARKVVFKSSSALSKDTTYQVTVGKHAQVSDGTLFEESLSYQFTTIGPVRAIIIQPKDKATNVAYDTQVIIKFNQNVEAESVKGAFSINPQISGSLVVDKYRLIFNHEAFDAATYVVTLRAGIIGLEGLPSNQEFRFSFTTKEKTVVLNVPVWRQEHRYSCFSAAVKQALAYRGVNMSETEITNAIGYDTTPWSGTWRDPNATWGDPDVGIVGDIDGKAPPGWGYGASPTRVAQAMGGFRSIDYKTGFTVQGIAQEIIKGNPVIVFWVNGYFPAYEVFWQKNGKRIRGVNSYHVQVVKGFVGSVNNPSALIVNDSGLGYPGKTIDVKTFKNRLGWFGNSAIIVY